MAVNDQIDQSCKNGKASDKQSASANPLCNIALLDFRRSPIGDIGNKCAKEKGKTGMRTI